MRFTPCRSSSAGSPPRASGAVAEALESRRLFASYFVDASALSSGNGSTGAPFKTIQAAANIVNPGDVVNVRPGTYNEKVIVTRSGSAALPVLFTATGEGVVVTSNSVEMWQGVIDIRASHTTFDNIDVRDSQWFGYIIQGNSGNRTTDVTVRNVHTARTWASGVYAKYTDGVVIASNRIEDACISPNAGDNTQECITLGEVHGFDIAGNVIWNNAGNNGISNGGEGIDAKGSSRDGVIRDNLVYSLADIGIYLDSGSKQGTGPDDDRPMENITVTRNIVRNTGDGVVVASELGGTVKNVVISNNLLYNNKTNGISIAGYLANGPRKNILIVNNTVHNNGYGNNGTTWGGGINVQTANYTNIRIQNNVVTNNESWQIAHTEKNAAGAPVGELTVTSNIASAFAYSYWYPQPALIADPKYVNAAAGDFRIQSSSPAINYGAAGEAQAVDLTNAARYAAPDAGAYEYVPPAPTAITLAALSDTGVAGDNRTKLNNASATSNLSFIVAGTVAGATVSVYSGSTLLGNATATGTSTTVVTNGSATLADGVASIAATQTFASAPSASSPALAITVDSTSPLLLSAVSRKTHGAARVIYDLPLNLSGTSKVEPRQGGATSIVFTLTEGLIPADGVLSANEFALTNATFASATLSGVTLTLNMTGVINRKYATIGLRGVTDSAGNAIVGDTDVNVGNLVGDLNGSGRVTVTDQQIVKSNLNRPLSLSNFLSDLSLSGFITVTDQQIVKSNLQHALT